MKKHCQRQRTTPSPLPTPKHFRSRPVAFNPKSRHFHSIPQSTLSGFCVLVLTAFIFCSPTAPARGADSDVIINEIMYHPPLQLEDLQYIELFNRGDAAVDLSGWSFTKGIQFEFPPNTQLAAGAYLVICRN